MKKILIFIQILLVLILLAGCLGKNPSTDATITGYVTDGRGGPAVEGATVKWENYSTRTDATGYFKLPICSDLTSDLFIIKENRGTFKVQDVKLNKNEVLELEIPSRPISDPDSSLNPPTITTNISSGQELTGIIDLEISVSSDHPVYIYYAYLDGRQRSPQTVREVGANEGSYKIDTTQYPNGKTTLSFLAYDENGNATFYTIPVLINNIADDTQLPGDISNVLLLSVTSGVNIHFYSEPILKILREKGFSIEEDFFLENFHPQVAPDGGSIFVSIDWNPVDNADGFAVYRSFDSINYELVGRVIKEYFSDFSPLLASNKTVWYKLVPYNSFGEGKPVIRKVTPLPAFNLYLETPANEAHDVPLMPTFTWRNVCSGSMPEGVEFHSYIKIWDHADNLLLEERLSNTTCYELTEALSPGQMYKWDIDRSYYVQPDYDELGFTISFSASGEYNTENFSGTGSLNGEFIFTTTTEED